MDISLITSAVSAISAAKDIGRLALNQRDAALITAKVTELNDLLLKAQESLFAHNAQLLALHHEHAEAVKKLREAEEALAQRGRYTLVQVTDGQFAYRQNVAPEAAGAGEPGQVEPLHYVCQSCFDVLGKRIVLQRVHWHLDVPRLSCPSCKTEIKAPN